MMDEPISCDCGHSDKDHEMKYTKNFTFSIDNCKECICENFIMNKNISVSPSL